MPTIKQYRKSKTNWANAIYLGLVVAIGSWDISVVEKWMTPEAVACGGLIINVIMRRFTQLPLDSK